MMKRSIIIIAAFVLTTCAATAQKKKAIFVIIDGVSKDVIEKVSTPNLHAIAQEGALLSAYQGGERGAFNQTPTISAPGYNNVLTGVWYHKHNVPDNAIKAPNYHYPTIFRFFEDQYPSKRTAVFSSWQDNRTKLVGEGLVQTRGLKLDHHFDGLELDTVKYPHDKGRKFMSDIDQAVISDATRAITEDAPDLSWVYLEYTDDMGHMYGDSEQFHDAVQAADRRIGQLWKAIKERKEKYNEDWLIIVTTDHGRDPKTGRGHGGQTDRERASWIATNARDLNSYAKQTQQVAVVDILPTIARFMDIDLSADQQRELDGVPLIGKISLSQPLATSSAGKVDLTWTPANKDGKVKIWLSAINDHKVSGKYDRYQLVGEVPVNNGKYAIDLSRYPSSDFYKVVLEGRYNSVNRWIINNK